MRVLLMEKSDDLRQQARDVITSRGHLVSAHSSQFDALAAYAGADYLLVVVGLDAADSDGLSLIRRLRSLPEGKEIVILALVGAPVASTVVEAIQASVDDILLGSIDPVSLALRIVIAERRVAESAERARIQAARDTSERLVRAIFQLSQDGLVLTDDAGHLMEVNAAARELLAFGDRATTRDHRLQDLLIGSESAAANENWDILRHEGSLTGEMHISLADGLRRTIAYRLRANVIPGHHLGVLRDVSDARVARDER